MRIGSSLFLVILTLVWTTFFVAAAPLPCSPEHDLVRHLVARAPAPLPAGAVAPGAGAGFLSRWFGRKGGNKGANTTPVAGAPDGPAPPPHGMNSRPGTASDATNPASMNQASRSNVDGSPSPAPNRGPPGTRDTTLPPAMGAAQKVTAGPKGTRAPGYEPPIKRGDLDVSGQQTPVNKPEVQFRDVQVDGVMKRMLVQDKPVTPDPRLTQGLVIGKENRVMKMPDQTGKLVDAPPPITIDLGGTKVRTHTLYQTKDGALVMFDRQGKAYQRQLNENGEPVWVDLLTSSSAIAASIPMLGMGALPHGAMGSNVGSPDSLSTEITF